MGEFPWKSLSSPCDAVGASCTLELWRPPRGVVGLAG